MTDRDVVLEELRLVDASVRAAASAHLRGEPKLAISELAEAIVLARDVLADLRRAAATGAE